MMIRKNRSKPYPILLLMLIGLVCLFTLAQSPAALAQSDTAVARSVRLLEANQTGVDHPAGLAFSASGKAFHVLRGRWTGGAPPAETELARLTEYGDWAGTARIAAAVRDPINVTFDPWHGRLLILQMPNQHLLEVAERPDGSLDSGSIVRHRVRHFGLVDPQGMAVDPATGHFYILDAAGPRLVHVAPASDGTFESATITILDLQPAGLHSVRGLALDPRTGHLFVIDIGGQRLVELSQAGEVRSTRDLTGLALADPQALAFAPSGDRTDDASQLHLYIADAGTQAGQAAFGTDALTEATAVASGAIVEISFTALAAAPAASYISSLVNTIEAWQWNPPSPDSAGIVYVPDADRLLVSDSEVNEIPNLYEDANLFFATRDGTLESTLTTLAYDIGTPSKEPTGVSYNPANKFIYTSDDDKDHVYELDPGNDGQYLTSDDVATRFSTDNFLSGDPEGLTFAQGPGVIYIADGVNSEVYRISPGSDGIFNGVSPDGDDQVSSFDTLGVGLEDPEGIVYNQDSGNLYVVGKPKTLLFEFATDGTLVRTIDISASNSRKPAGLAYGPSSAHAGMMSIYIAARGVDNGADPDENDGMIYEMTLPINPPTAPAVGVSNGGGGITLSWPAVNDDLFGYPIGISNYQVWRSAQPYCTAGSVCATLAAEPALTLYSDGSPAMTEFYTVTAVSSTDVSSPDSNEVGIFGFALVTP